MADSKPPFDDDLPEGRDGDDYEVGYRKPPKQTRFKKGQSGNPKGRPKGLKNLATDLREELSERITVRENGRVKRMSKQRALVKAQVAKALGADPRAMEATLKLIANIFGAGDDQIAEAPLSSEDREILETYLGGDDEPV
jgi:hypothetical protein